MSYEKAISFDELYKAGKECFRNVRWKDSTVGYEANILKNTHNLRQELLNNTYKISPYQHFFVYEPKKREIVATRLRDRQFQRSLCNNGVYEDITRSFIHDNCACQIGKGIDFALDRLTAHMRRYANEYGQNGWVLKCDIKSYFANIRHDEAKRVVYQRVRDKQSARRVCDIIDSFGEVGLGLGSQISQLVALALLDDIDHYIKEVLKIKYYIRYMDDFILIHPDKEYLLQCKKIIADKLSEIGLELNNKTDLHPLQQGIKFLKWHFQIMDSKRIIRKIDKSKLGAERRKLKRIYEKELAGVYKKGTTEQSLSCWLANADRGDTYYEQQNMISYYENLVVQHEHL